MFVWGKGTFKENFTILIDHSALTKCCIWTKQKANEIQTETMLVFSSLKISCDVLTKIDPFDCHMWHDQGEWVGCRGYWFWVTGLKTWQILMYFIVFKRQRMFVSPQPDVRLRWGLDQNVAF